MFKRYIPFLGFILITVIFFWQFLFKGLTPIPTDTIVGLYYPYRDIFEETNPNGIPFKNFLITDPVRQQYPWKNLSIESYKNSILPTWNPYALSGTPNLANFQSAVFYPVNIIFFFLPFHISWSFFILIQPLLAGIFLYLYLRNLKLDEYSSFLGGTVFAFSGFSAMWLEWGTVLQTALWLPLILLSLDKLYLLFENKKIKLVNKNVIYWLIVFIAALTFSFFAGHLQTFFYLIIFTTIYLIFKVWQSRNRIKLAFTCFVSITLSFLFVFPQLIPTLKFISLSARGSDQLNWQAEGWFLPLRHLVQFVAPDFFGNPTTLNYWGVWNYGELTAFVGITGIILSIIAIFYRRDKKTLFFFGAFLTAIIFSISNPIAKLPFLLGFPFISTAQPTRLIFIIDFSLSVLTALGLNYLILKGKPKQILFPLGVVGFILIGLLIFVQLNLINSSEIINMLVARRNLILPLITFVLTFIILFSITFSKKKIKSYIILALILLTIFELFRFSWKFNTFSKKDYLYPETKSIIFIKENIGNYRVATADARIMAPNFSMMHEISSVEGYDPLFLDRYAKLISAINRGKPDISPPYGFNRIVRLENFSSDLVDLMGVKYVLSLDELNIPGFVKVLSDGNTKVYENKNVIPRVFFVSKVNMVNSEQKVIDLLFNSEFNPRREAVIEENFSKNNFSLGKAKITKYQSDNVVIETENKSEGFLVLTDSFYPTWRVTVNGKEQKIYRTNFNFRGVIVPKGNNTVEFKNSLL